MTLPELLIVSFTFSVLGLLVYGTFSNQSEAFARATNVNVTQRGLRAWLARMGSDIRRAGYNPLWTSPSPFTIGAHSCSDFEFKLDDDANGTLASSGTAEYAKEVVGYRLNSSTQWLEMLNGSTWRPLFGGVQSLTFAYRDTAGTLMDCTDPNLVTQDIKQVQITITAQADSGSPRAPSQIVAETATVELRNDIP